MTDTHLDEVRVCRVGDGTERLRALGVMVAAGALVVYALLSRVLAPPVDGAAPPLVAAVSAIDSASTSAAHLDEFALLSYSPAQEHQAWLDHRAGEREQLWYTPAQAYRAWLDYRAAERTDLGTTSQASGPRP